MKHRNRMDRFIFIEKPDNQPTIYEHSKKPRRFKHLRKAMEMESVFLPNERMTERTSVATAMQFRRQNTEIHFQLSQLKWSFGSLTSPSGE